jgi:DMSO/TMAO reductase YedYZ heme-binding membrane subunit
VSTTSGRTRSRHGVRSGTQGALGEHYPKIVAVLATATIVIVAGLAMTAIGHDIDAATQRFMLYYAGVFALIGLTAAVGIGLAATDRIVMSPGHRVMAQAIHRAVSFGALAFLVIHIVTEILAQRAHVIDAFIPFLSPFRTFYIGLGTIASDLIVLIVITSLVRTRFTGHGKAWRWRAIHYTAYVAFVFGILHGLLGGRAAKPYVDWSYGFCIAFTALGLVVRFLATSLHPKETLGAPPGADKGPGSTGSSPLRAAALGMAQAQLGGTVQVLPAAAVAQGPGAGMPGRRLAELPAGGWSSPSGSFPAVGAAPAYMTESSSPDPAYLPLGAPLYADPVRARAGRYPEAAAPPRAALAGPTAPGTAMQPGNAMPQPHYEPGYDGPPRFMGAPRRDVQSDDPSSYPYDTMGSRPSAQLTQPGQNGRNTGSVPGGGSGRGRGGTGPLPGASPGSRGGTGPLPRADGGPVPRAGGGRAAGSGTGPSPRAGTGPNPRPATSSMPRADAGPAQRPGSPQGPRTGPRHGSGTRPTRRADPADAYRDAPRSDRGDEWR